MNNIGGLAGPRTTEKITMFCAGIGNEFAPAAHPYNLRTRLTKAEAQCLLHRLEVSDCIAEALEEYATDRGSTMAAVEDKAEALACYVRSEQALPRLDPDDSIGREVMMEAVEGSTWLSVHDSHVECGGPRQAAVAARRTLESVAEKVRVWAGRDSIMIPDC